MTPAADASKDHQPRRDRCRCRVHVIMSSHDVATNLAIADNGRTRTLRVRTAAASGGTPSPEAPTHCRSSVRRADTVGGDEAPPCPPHRTIALLTAACSKDAATPATDVVAETSVAADTTTPAATADTTISDSTLGDVAADSAAASAAATSSHNAADVSFAQGMLPHHQQAIAMAMLVIDQGANADVRALADMIRNEQTPEIGQLRAMLKAWGEPDTMAPMEGMDQGIDGMASADDMTAMGALSGADIDKKFVEMMIAHHEGAVAMATVENKSGSDPKAIGLADAIIKSQTGQIATLKLLQAKL